LIDYIARKTYILNTGDKIPAIGLGTWQSKPNEVGKAVEAALRLGYRHIDTAVSDPNNVGSLKPSLHSASKSQD